MADHNAVVIQADARGVAVYETSQRVKTDLSHVLDQPSVNTYMRGNDLRGTAGNAQWSAVPAGVLAERLQTLRLAVDRWRAADSSASSAHLTSVDTTY